MQRYKNINILNRIVNDKSTAVVRTEQNSNR
jgi:hypothetical protein